nr:hypothetical protein [Paenibacillus mangrovi]
MQETRKWFQSFRLYGILAPIELHLLFGALGVQFLYDLLISILPYSSNHVLSFIFHTIPLLVIAQYAFWVGAWLTLVSSNVKYLPYALWINAFIILFPFGFGGLISALVYALLGYVLFKYSASSYANINRHPGEGSI